MRGKVNKFEIGNYSQFHETKLFSIMESFQGMSSQTLLVGRILCKRKYSRNHLLERNLS